jgi:3-phosphoshikimate 1-carboxyvinyltransferase
MTQSNISDPLAVPAWNKSFDYEVGLPGSKSITLRDCVIAALAEGESTISFPGECDDYWRMKDCLQRLHVPLVQAGPEAIRIRGNGGRFEPGRVELFTGQSAASTRLLLSVAALRRDATAFDAHVSMRARPNKDLLDALEQLGVRSKGERPGYLPLELEGPEQMGSRVRVRGDVSSQFVSSLLIIAPVLERGLTIDIEGGLVSRPYVDITLDEMAKFGVEVQNDDYRRFVVAPQRYRAKALGVEGDASASSYFAALATLHGGRIKFKNLGQNTRQGDYGFLEVCEALGARVRREAQQTEIVGPSGPLKPFEREVDMTRMPDVAPTLMVMAPFIPGTTRIVGLSTLRVKECDRIAAPANELRKLGVSVVEGPDFIQIESLSNGRAQAERRVAIDTYHDHRIAMSFGVIATKLAGVSINDPNCVSKTYPLFWQHLAACAASPARA